MESFGVKCGAEREAAVWSDMCSRKAHGDTLLVGLSTQGEKAGLGGAEARGGVGGVGGWVWEVGGWSWMELDAATFRNTSFLLWCFISLLCWSGSLPLILL